MSERTVLDAWRDALVAAILPAPGNGLPAAAALDLSGFWPRFSAAAPFHLRLGWNVAVVVLAGGLPRLLGYRGSLTALGEEEREAVVARAWRTALLGPLVEVAKVVACMAYFSDPAVAAVARSRT